MNLLLAALLMFQVGVRNDISQLRQYLGATYPAAVDLLNAKNQILLRNTQPLAPAQAAQMRAQMQVPETLPAVQTVLSTGIQNIGQGLVTLLFEDDFLVERVNFVFCPPDLTSAPAKPERVMAVQVLFDDSRALGTTVGLLRDVYQMPAPIIPAPDFMPQLMYPLAPNLPVTFWEFDSVEAVYQPVPNPLIRGQLWLTDKTVVGQCTNIPRLPTP
jgi:hypothetical protein